VSNSLALRYNRSINLKELESSNTLNKKHNRQISSISSDIKVIKRVKTSDLIQLSSLDLNSNTLSSLLKEFLQDNNASFKSLEQELLIKSILLKIPYILVVLPTSIGKSLAYLLTSSLSISKVTIVILPLVGLKQDILRRSKEFNIPSIIFEDTKQFQNLTLVSIETIIEGTFISLV
jgi:superfamily II DNA helicase RecQ